MLLLQNVINGCYTVMVILAIIILKLYLIRIDCRYEGAIKRNDEINQINNDLPDNDDEDI